jgi:hypothetical protein
MPFVRHGFWSDVGALRNHVTMTFSIGAPVAMVIFGVQPFLLSA